MFLRILKQVPSVPTEKHKLFIGFVLVRTIAGSHQICLVLAGCCQVARQRGIEHTKRCCTDGLVFGAIHSSRADGDQASQGRVESSEWAQCQ